VEKLIPRTLRPDRLIPMESPRYLSLAVPIQAIELDCNLLIRAYDVQFPTTQDTAIALLDPDKARHKGDQFLLRLGCSSVPAFRAPCSPNPCVHGGLPFMPLTANPPCGCLGASMYLVSALLVPGGPLRCHLCG